MFKDVDRLQKCASLRVKYLLNILHEVISATKGMPEVQANLKIPSTTESLLQKLTNVAMDSQVFELLVVFDAIQFNQFWAREWASLLTKATSMSELLQLLGQSTKQNASGATAMQAFTAAAKTHHDEGRVVGPRQGQTGWWFVWLICFLVLCWLRFSLELGIGV